MEWSMEWSEVPRGKGREDHRTNLLYGSTDGMIWDRREEMELGLSLQSRERSKK